MTFSVKWVKNTILEKFNNFNMKKVATYIWINEVFHFIFRHKNFDAHLV